MVDFTTHILMDMVSVATRPTIRVPNPAEKTWLIRGGSVVLDIDVEVDRQPHSDMDRFAVYATFKVEGVPAADFDITQLIGAKLAVYRADDLEACILTWALDQYLSAQFKLARGEYRLSLFVS